MNNSTAVVAIAGIGALIYFISQARSAIAAPPGGNALTYSGGGLNIAIPNMALDTLFSGSPSTPTGGTPSGLGRLSRWTV